VAYSREVTPLETAGGIAQALPLLGAAPFLLVNADIYCEITFAPLLAHELAAKLAHLVLVPNPPHRAQGDFSFADGRVGKANGARYTYTGVAVMSPRLVAPVARGTKAPLAPLLYAAAEEQRLSGELFQGLWQDVGTPERLVELETQLAMRP
jgi:MurNAc alpha-1-phosphate uridylyltransferase